MAQNDNLKNFCNREYRGQVVSCKDGVVEFWIAAFKSSQWIQVSEVVYKLLTNDPERMRKSDSRYYQRTHSVDVVYEGTVENYSAQDYLESVYPQMTTPSAEDAFYKENICLALRSFVENMGDEWLDLFDAIFIAEIPASDYAKQIGKPASTVRSRKNRLRQKLQKFVENF